MGSWKLNGDILIVSVLGQEVNFWVLEFIFSGENHLQETRLGGTLWERRESRHLDAVLERWRHGYQESLASREKMKQVMRMGYGRLTMLLEIPNAVAGYIQHSLHAVQIFLSAALEGK